MARLPNAPSMKFICVYGHGKETEVCGDVVELSGYGINPRCPSDPTGRPRRRNDHAQSKLIVPDCQVCSRPTSAERLAGRFRTVKWARCRARQPCSFRVRQHLSISLKLDRRRVHERELDSQGMKARWCLENVLTIAIQVRNGVKIGEGDGTVSLLSMGAMCIEGWKRPRWNPARINVTTVEVRRLIHIDVQLTEMDVACFTASSSPCAEHASRWCQYERPHRHSRVHSFERDHSQSCNWRRPRN